jgi:hypothetical protein
MKSTGKLKHNKRGVGSLLGCVFLLLIMLSSYLLFESSMKTKSEYDEAIVEASALAVAAGVHQKPRWQYREN